MAEPILKYRLWKQVLCWLLLLGPLFFLSYGQVNQFTATRDGIGSIVFRWEHQIPFISWTIVPYWSIDLLYGISLFICASTRELARHGYRLLAASIIACLAFLLFPLKFTFVRPQTQGLFGWLFRQLEQFDLPYNQAPSLHIILTWLLWLRFRQHLNQRARLISATWFLLIAVSVLTAWQHHFIDVVSGFIVAVTISYLIPVDGAWHWQRPTSHAIRIATKYATGGVIFLFAGLMIPYGYILLWPAIAVLLVSAGYMGLGTAVFQKNINGELSLSARIFLLPYLAGAKLSKYLFSRYIPKTSAICEGIYLGAFPVSQIQQNAVLDLTTEFHKSSQQKLAWRTIPLMDLLVPGERDIVNALAELHQLHQSHSTVLICCALGLSRSATIAAAWLLTRGYANSVEQAIGLIASQRPQVVLTGAHIQRLKEFQEKLCPISQ